MKSLSKALGKHYVPKHSVMHFRDAAKHSGSLGKSTFRATANYNHEALINMMFLITWIAIIVKSISKALKKQYVYEHSAMRFRDGVNPLKSLGKLTFRATENTVTKPL